MGSAAAVAVQLVAVALSVAIVVAPLAGAWALDRAFDALEVVLDG